MKTKADLVLDKEMKQVAGGYDSSHMEQWEEFMLKSKYDALMAENFTLRELYQSVIDGNVNKAIDEARNIMELMNTERYVTAQQECIRWLFRYNRRVT